VPLTAVGVAVVGEEGRSGPGVGAVVPAVEGMWVAGEEAIEMVSLGAWRKAERLSREQEDGNEDRAMGEYSDDGNAEGRRGCAVRGQVRGWEAQGGTGGASKCGARRLGALLRR